MDHDDQKPPLKIQLEGHASRRRLSPSDQRRSLLYLQLKPPFVTERDHPASLRSLTEWAVKTSDLLRELLADLNARLDGASPDSGPQPGPPEDLVAQVQELQNQLKELQNQVETHRDDLNSQRALRESLGISLQREMDSLRQDVERRFVQDAEKERRLEDVLRQLQRPSDAEIQADIQILQKQILQIRQAQDIELLEILKSRLPDPETDPEETPPEGEVHPDALYDAAARLQALLGRASSPALEQKLGAEIDQLKALGYDLEMESRLQERASDILKLLLPRLLEQGPAERLHQRARHYVFVHLPDLLEDLEDLGRRELAPEHLGALHHALEGILEDMGLEEIRPARGDALKASEHSLLRVERTPEPGMEGRIAQCLRAGLRLRSSGELVRKAEVSVYP